MAPCAPTSPEKLRLGRADAFILRKIRLDLGVPADSRRRVAAAWSACQPAGAA